jgi:hypothetical protein
LSESLEIFKNPPRWPPRLIATFAPKQARANKAVASNAAGGPVS